MSRQKSAPGKSAMPREGRHRCVDRRQASMLSRLSWACVLVKPNEGQVQRFDAPMCNTAAKASAAVLDGPCASSKQNFSSFSVALGLWSVELSVKGSYRTF